MIPALFTVTLALFVSISIPLAATSPSSDGSAPRLVSLPITRHKHPGIAAGLERRAGFEANVLKLGSGPQHVTHIAFGYPGQVMTLEIDTGSPYTWVNPNCDRVSSEAAKALCRQFRKFMPGESFFGHVWNFVGEYAKGKFSVTYQFYTGQMGFGTAAHLPAQVFGIAADSQNFVFGVLGLGLGGNGLGFLSVMDNLVVQRAIHTRTFSLDYGGKQRPEGTIIFGGLDRMRYAGPLEAIPLLPAAQRPENVDRYWIFLDGLGATLPGRQPLSVYQASTPGQARLTAYIDSVAPVIRVPQTILHILSTLIKITYDNEYSAYMIDCEESKMGSIDFIFGATTIHLPLSELTWPTSDGRCAFGLVPFEGPVVLGSNFLRAAYMVIDQDNQQIHLGQAANCGSDPVAILPGAGVIDLLPGRCASSSGTHGDATSAPHTLNQTAAFYNKNSSVSSFQKR